MSVVIDAVSVILRVKTIEGKYPGGIHQYESDCPNRTFCSDGILARVAFMTGADAQRFVDSLERLGFVRQRDGVAIDIATVEQFVYHPAPPCPWVTVGIHPERYASAWLTGADPGVLAHPTWWTAEASAEMIRVPEEQTSGRILQLDVEGPLREVLDYNTGKINYVGHAYGGTAPGPLPSSSTTPDARQPTTSEKPQQDDEGI